MCRVMPRRSSCWWLIRGTDVAGICTSDVNLAGGSDAHRRLTISFLGENHVFDYANTELDSLGPLTTAQKRAFLETALRLKREGGLSVVDALNRVFVGDEGSNVKIWPILTKDVTKTNIGTSYVNVPVGLNGERKFVDFTGCTQFRIRLWANLIGTGAFAARIIRDSDSTVLFESTNLGAAGERELDSGWQNLPAGFTGEEVLRLQAKSATNTDDPIFRSCDLATK